MKIIRYSSILALSVLLLGTWTSCDIATVDDDAFLEEHPTTTFGFETAFLSASQINDCITACYMGLRFAYYNEDSIWLGWGTDLMDRREEGWEGNFTNWTAESNPFRDPTYSLWQRVAAPAILGLDGMKTEGLDITDADRKNYEAQLRFFKGFIYLRLAEMYGGWFLMDKTYTSLKFDIPRATRQETYEYAIQDLKFAAENLEDHPEAGRVGKGAAYHFLAEAYLALAIEKGNSNADLETAIGYADKAIELHPIMTQRFGTRATPGKGTARNGVAAYYPDGDVFFDLFQPGNFDYDEGNTESIWAMQQDYDNFVALGKSSWGRNGMHRYYLPSKRTVTWNSTYKQGSNDYPWRKNVDATLYPGGEYSAYVGGKPSQTWFPTDYVVCQIWAGGFADDMRNNDVNIRRKFKCTDKKHPLYGQIVTKEMVDTTTRNPLMSFVAPTYTKFAPIDDWAYFDLADGGDRSYRFYDSYVVRSAETVLLRAEAKLRKGDKGGCASDINILRNRAQCSKLATAGEMDIKYILAERVRELYLEEWRWATLLRMGQDGIDSINEHAMHMVKQPCYNNLPTTNVAPITKWTLLPIWDSLIKSMKDADVQNNPGWN